METWPSYLPIWTKDYSSGYSNAVLRSGMTGKKTQRRITQRNIEIAGVSLVLPSAYLAVFEYFVQVLLNSGQDFFTGYINNSGVIESGTIRIVGGAYNVEAISTELWRVNCQIEVKRA